MKKHLFDKEKGRHFCGARSFHIEYAKTIDEVNCFYCKKYIDKLKMEIHRLEMESKLKEIKDSLVH